MWFKKSTLYVCLLAGAAMALAMTGKTSGQNSSTATEAPSGFDNQPNGLTDAATFTMDRGKFEDTESIGDGLGPIYNAQSCRECHQNPVTGAGSQVKELRAGHQDPHGNFVGATATLADGAVTLANRSLINQRAVCPAVDTITVNGQQQAFNFPQTQGQERITTAETIRAFRMSLNTIGDGFIESIADQTILDLASSQCTRSNGAICGEAVHVAVLEANGALAVGRFGWKDQHASLLSFSSDAYLNEMGISNRLPPNNVDVTRICDVVPDPNDNTADSEGLNDIDHFARFMRATKAPPRDTALATSSDGVAGAKLFHSVGCDILPRFLDHYGADRLRRRRGSVHRARFFGQQDHSSLQRFPAAQRGYWRRHRANRRPGNGSEAAHASSLGCPHAHGAVARRTLKHVL